MLRLRVMSGRASSILKFFKPTLMNDAQGNELTSQEKLESRLAADRPRMAEEKAAAEKDASANRQREEVGDMVRACLHFAFIARVDMVRAALCLSRTCRHSARFTLPILHVLAWCAPACTLPISRLPALCLSRTC